MKVLKCVDVGNQGCDAVFRAETPEEILKQLAEHAKSVHNTQLTPEMEASAKALIKDEAPPQKPAEQPAQKPPEQKPAAPAEGDKPQGGAPAGG